MSTRPLGLSGIEVSALGMGCWAIGGPFARDGRPVGWGDVDDAESVRAIHKALELGITFFDTADVYGCGHSERILGQALKEANSEVTVATKFGNVFDEDTKNITGSDGSPAYVRQACEASLRRLDMDYIDLLQFHVGNYDLDQAEATRDALEALVEDELIRAYGWSTDDPERAAFFAEGPNCVAIQQRLNIFEGDEDTLAVCEYNSMASINRGPLAMGLLTGKFSPDTALPENDIRHTWSFREGVKAEQLGMLDSIRAILTHDGHTLAQAAIAWLWALSPVTIPIPGFKTVEQVAENAGALALGPLSPVQMEAIGLVLGGEPEEDSSE